jgi:hypothetical protein
MDPHHLYFHLNAGQISELEKQTMDLVRVVHQKNIFS